MNFTMNNLEYGYVVMLSICILRSKKVHTYIKKANAVEYIVTRGIILLLSQHFYSLSPCKQHSNN